jgi:hypothetical protein
MNTPKETPQEMVWVNPNLRLYYACKLLGIILVCGVLGYVFAHRSTYLAADSREALLYLAPLLGAGYLLMAGHTLRGLEPADTKLGIILKIGQILLSLPCFAYFLLAIYRLIQSM